MSSKWLWEKLFFVDESKKENSLYNTKKHKFTKYHSFYNLLRMKVLTPCLLCTSFILTNARFLSDNFNA